MTNANIAQVVQEMRGQKCEGVDNPYGSILRLEIGPLGHRAGDAPGARAHGWRHVTINSPWRLEDGDRVICDWNFSGGARGELTPLLQTLIGRTVEMAAAAPPGWDLRLEFSGGLILHVFSDSDDEREEAWTILGTDGIEVNAGPVLKNGGRSPGAH